MGSCYQCVVDAWELTLVKVFFSDCGKTRPYFWVFGRLDSGHIVNFFFCATMGCT